MSFVTLINKTSSPISIMVDGKHIVLNAEASNVFPDSVGNAFVTKFGDQVEKLDLSSVVPESKKAKKVEMWFANISGNPDAPDLVEETFVPLEGGERKTRTVKNPFKQPRTWREEMKGSMVFNPSDPEQFRWASPEIDPHDIDWSSSVNETVPAMKVFEVFEIPPFKIAKFSETVGSWIQRRNSSSVKTDLGLMHLIESREPPAFRPDLNWSLDDIRYYLTLARPEFDQEKGKPKLGATEAEVRSKNATKDKEDIEQALFEAKNEVLTRVFFALADPQITLPSQEEFEAFKQFKDSKKAAKATTSTVA